ncbi:hypothetical protein C8J57DRAFT_1257929 [Mycena rebaudengoi]|nr:hypothetical protein C8J57DRAFT_1257929 [Mycena rebaudengoi]
MTPANEGNMYLGRTTEKLQQHRIFSGRQTGYSDAEFTGTEVTLGHFGNSARQVAQSYFGHLGHPEISGINELSFGIPAAVLDEKCMLALFYSQRVWLMDVEPEILIQCHPLTGHTGNTVQGVSRVLLGHRPLLLDSLRHPLPTQGLWGVMMCWVQNALSVDFVPLFCDAGSGQGPIVGKTVLWHIEEKCCTERWFKRRGAEATVEDWIMFNLNMFNGPMGRSNRGLKFLNGSKRHFTPGFELVPHLHTYISRPTGQQQSDWANSE